jgi:osmotically-inducible protein OsmY
MMRYVPQQRVLLGEVPAVKVQRSDARILEDVCEALRGDEWIDATHIEVDVRDQNVMLTGEVRERNQKWLAEDLVERVLGVRAVVNRVRVGFRELEGPFIKPEKAPMSTEHTEDNGHRTRQ